MSVISTIITVTGTPTMFLPLPTVFSASRDCFSSLWMPDAYPNTLIAWDPVFATFIHPDEAASACIHPAISIYLEQTGTGSGGLTTELGPTFMCPEQFTSAWSTVLETSLHKTHCCPSGYSFTSVWAPPGFPSQCVSTVPVGSEITYWDNSHLQHTLVAAQGTPIIAWGEPANGFNIVTDGGSSSSSSSSDGRSSSSSSDGGATTTTSRFPSASMPITSFKVLSSSTSALTTNTAASAPAGNGSNVAVSVGASVGAVVGILIVAAGAFWIWRRLRRRRGKTTQPPDPEYTIPAATPKQQQMRRASSYPPEHNGMGGVPAPASELWGSGPELSEMPSR